MRISYLLCFLIVLVSGVTYAGDDASGSIEYRVDLGQKFDLYALTKKDRAWGTRLAQKFKYKGKVIYFTRTSIVQLVEGKKVEGAVYQSVENPDYFYVVHGDAMLKIGAEYPISPGVGGFSMSVPRSKNFIACFYCFSGGVPFLSGSSVKKGEVEWDGGNFKRF